MLSLLQTIYTAHVMISDLDITMKLPHYFTKGLAKSVLAQQCWIRCSIKAPCVWRGCSPQNLYTFGDSSIIWDRLLACPATCRVKTRCLMGPQGPKACHSEEQGLKVATKSSCPSHLSLFSHLVPISIQRQRF